MLESTDSDYAPWPFVEGNDIEFATIKVFMLLINIMESKLSEHNSSQGIQEGIKMFDPKISELNSSTLNKVDLSQGINKDDYEKELDKCKEQLSSLAYDLYNKKPLL